MPKSRKLYYRGVDLAAIRVSRNGREFQAVPFMKPSEKSQPVQIADGNGFFYLLIDNSHIILDL
jgi:hypothetical protein